MDHHRLSMPLGEAIFNQRAIRRFTPDPIPIEDLHLILDAASKAPNGGNRQIARFLVLNEPAVIRAFGALYREAWWAKRTDEGFTEADLPEKFGPARQLADNMMTVPCVVLAWALDNGPGNSVIPAVQNLMLSAMALGIGSTPTTLHASVMPRVHELLGVPDDVAFHFCIPMGFPVGNFGPTQRRPTSETTFLDHWGSPVPWT